MKKLQLKQSLKVFSLLTIVLSFCGFASSGERYTKLYITDFAKSINQGIPNNLPYSMAIEPQMIYRLRVHQDSPTVNLPEDAFLNIMIVNQRGERIDFRLDNFGKTFNDYQGFHNFPVMRYGEWAAIIASYAVMTPTGLKNIADVTLDFNWYTDLGFFESLPIANPGYLINSDDPNIYLQVPQGPAYTVLDEAQIKPFTKINQVPKSTRFTFIPVPNQSIELDIQNSELAEWPLASQQYATNYGKTLKFSSYKSGEGLDFEGEWDRIASITATWHKGSISENAVTTVFNGQRLADIAYTIPDLSSFEAKVGNDQDYLLDLVFMTIDGYRVDLKDIPFSSVRSLAPPKYANWDFSRRQTSTVQHLCSHLDMESQDDRLLTNLIRYSAMIGLCNHETGQIDPTYYQDVSVTLKSWGPSPDQLTNDLNDYSYEVKMLAGTYNDCEHSADRRYTGNEIKTPQLINTSSNGVEYVFQEFEKSNRHFNQFVAWVSEWNGQVSKMAEFAITKVTDNRTGNTVDFLPIESEWTTKPPPLRLRVQDSVVACDLGPDNIKFYADRDTTEPMDVVNYGEVNYPDVHIYMEFDLSVDADLRFELYDAEDNYLFDCPQTPGCTQGPYRGIVHDGGPENALPMPVPAGSTDRYHYYIDTGVYDEDFTLKVVATDSAGGEYELCAEIPIRFNGTPNGLGRITYETTNPTVDTTNNNVDMSFTIAYGGLPPASIVWNWTRQGGISAQSWRPNTTGNGYWHWTNGVAPLTDRVIQVPCDPYYHPHEETGGENPCTLGEVGACTDRANNDFDDNWCVDHDAREGLITLTWTGDFNDFATRFFFNTDSLEADLVQDVEAELALKYSSTVYSESKTVDAVINKENIIIIEAPDEVFLSLSAVHSSCEGSDCYGFSNPLSYPINYVTTDNLRIQLKETYQTNSNSWWLSLKEDETVLYQGLVSDAMAVLYESHTAQKTIFKPTNSAFITALNSVGTKTLTITLDQNTPEVYETMTLIATQPSNNLAIEYNFRDHLGSSSVTQVFSPNTPYIGATPQLQIGQNTQLYDLGYSISYFSPFGKPLESPNVSQTGLSSEPRFTDHEHDRSSGYNYMKARFQTPVAAKFNRPDPERDWDWENPQSLNLYQYARNNPIDITDPTGLKIVESKEVKDNKAWKAVKKAILSTKHGQKLFKTLEESSTVYTIQIKPIEGPVAGKVTDIISNNGVLESASIVLDEKVIDGSENFSTKGAQNDDYKLIDTDLNKTESVINMVGHELTHAVHFDNNRMGTKSLEISKKFIEDTKDLKGAERAEAFGQDKATLILSGNRDRETIATMGGNAVTTQLKLKGEQKLKKILSNVREAQRETRKENKKP